MRYKNVVLLIMVYVFGMFISISNAAAGEPYPNSDQIKRHIGQFTGSWLKEKRTTFSGFFGLEIDNGALDLFFKSLTDQLANEGSRSIVVGSFRKKEFVTKKFFFNTKIFVYKSLDDALLFQIYLDRQVKDVVSISVKAIQMVVKSLGCDTPPCDFKFWCPCFYSNTK
ncbi:MAG: hypothetical protein ABIL06_11745 [Pseudomonadota bacterium]